VNIDLSAAQWYKSSRSKESRACVEVAHLDGGLVGIRDSKNPTGPALILDAGEWEAFTTGIKRGQFDHA
jgi:hypothetical protein